MIQKKRHEVSIGLTNGVSISLSDILARTGNLHLSVLLMTLLIIGSLLLFGGIIYFQIKLFCILFAIVMRELSINFYVGIVLYILAACVWVHLPLYLVMSSKYAKGYKFYELFPIWFLKKTNLWYTKRFQPQVYVAISLGGGIVPIIVALYQFSHSSPVSILVVTAIVIPAGYLLAVLIPGKGICLKWHHFWIITVLSAVSALQVTPENHSSAASIAFAGSVLGTLIGVDLLHLREAQTRISRGFLSIGGAGIKDGIVHSGIASLLIAKWLPYSFNFFQVNTELVVDIYSILIAMACLFVISRNKHG